MPTFIVTGNYTPTAIQGLLKKPSDREKAARAIFEAVGGKLETFYLTTGEHDFSAKVTIDDAKDLMAAVMVVGASGAVSHLKTVRAYTASEFQSIQKKAAEVAKTYMAPGA